MLHDYLGSFSRTGNFLFITSGKRNLISEMDLTTLKSKTFSSFRISPGPLAYSKNRNVLYTVAL
jgi:hypothetical protein